MWNKEQYVAEVALLFKLYIFFFHSWASFLRGSFILRLSGGIPFHLIYVKWLNVETIDSIVLRCSAEVFYFKAMIGDANELFLELLKMLNKKSSNIQSIYIYIP